jgi:hypothetical protein
MVFSLLSPRDATGWGFGFEHEVMVKPRSAPESRIEDSLRAGLELSVLG